MTRMVMTLVVALAMIACKTAGPPEPMKPATPPEVVAMGKQTVEAWRAGWQTKTFETLAPLYAHDLDVAVIQEGAMHLGWSSVEAMLKDRFVRATEIRVRLKDVQVVAQGAEVATVVATMVRESVEGSSSRTETGTLSLVLRRQPDGAWLIVVEHFSYRRQS